MQTHAVLTIDQWEEDEYGDYAIGNLTDGETVFFTDIYTLNEDIRTYVESMTGYEVVRLTQRPFNPYGDGRTFDVVLSEPIRDEQVVLHLS